MSHFIKEYRAYALVVFMVFVRLFTLNLQPLDFDELITANLIAHEHLDFILSWIRTNDTQMPLFYILEHYTYHLVGHSVFYLRLVSFLSYLIGLYYSYKFVFLLDGHEKARRALLLLSTSFLLFFHSAQARPYALVFALSAACLYLMTLYLKKEKSFLPVALCLVLLGLTHYYALMFSGLIALWCLVVRRNYIFMACIAILVALFLYMYGADFITDFLVIHTFRSPLTLYGLAMMVNYFLGGILCSLMITALLIFVLIKSDKKTVYAYLKDKAFFIYLMVFCLSIALLKSILIAPSLEARYLIILLLPVAYLLTDLFHQPKVFILFLTFSLTNIFLKENILTVPYRLASQEASEHAKNLQLKHSTATITSCNINLSYYLHSFKDCFAQNCALKKKVIYINYLKNPRTCQVSQKLETNYDKVSTSRFKFLEVSLYVRQTKD